MPQTISVLYCYPRSGGTLLNQCLLCAKCNVVLSEVNPAGSFLPIERQAHEWFGLINAREAASLGAKTYLEKIALLAQRCSRRKQQLCVRDWSAINFIPDLNPLSPAASGVLEQQLFLQEAGYTVRDMALLRRSSAIFHSMRAQIPGMEDYSLRRFAREYRAYLEAVADRPRFYLEDFIADPPANLRRICRVLGLDFPPRFQDQFHRQQHVTGNNTLPTKPPSAAATRIRAARPATRGKPATRRELSLFAELDELAGYATEAKG